MDVCRKPFVFFSSVLFCLVFKVNGKAIHLNSGEQFAIDCPNSSHQDGIIYLHKRMYYEMVVVNVTPAYSKVHADFTDLVKTEVLFNKCRITLINLKEVHSGVYWCSFCYFNSTCYRDDSTLLVAVSDKCKLDSKDEKRVFLILTVLSVGCWFLCVLIPSIWLVTKLKWHKKIKVQNAPPDSVYEDMRMRRQEGPKPDAVI